jgi:hypothetical protein
MISQLPSGIPASILLIGNSFFYYNNGINHHLNGFVLADDPAYNLRTVMVTISGGGVDWHDVKSYFRPNALSRYSFDADNTVVFNTLDRLFDVAILLDSSQGPIHPELRSTFETVGAQHIETIRANGAEPVLFMSWAYKDMPEMTEALAEAYVSAGERHGVLVIPAGLAFARSIAARRDLDLYVADKRHPSLAGTYLATAVSYASLFRRSPVGNSYSAELEPDVAAYLQQVAWDTVQSFKNAEG